MVRPIPRWAESSFFVNRSPISAMRALKQKKVSASACSERENRKISECSFQGFYKFFTFPSDVGVLEEYVV